MIHDKLLVESVHKELTSSLIKSGQPITIGMIKIATEVCLAFIEEERGVLVCGYNKDYTDDITVDAMGIKGRYRNLKLETENDLSQK